MKALLSTKAGAKANVPTSPAFAFTPARAGLLQRKRPFNGAAGLAKDLDEEPQERSILQRRHR